MKLENIFIQYNTKRIPNKISYKFTGGYLT